MAQDARVFVAMFEHEHRDLEVLGVFSTFKKAVDRTWEHYQNFQPRDSHLAMSASYIVSEAAVDGEYVWNLYRGWERDAPKYEFMNMYNWYDCGANEQASSPGYGSWLYAGYEAPPPW